jgi:putative hydrolase of the HAD superfamily
MSFTTLLIDLDDTVYPADCGMWNAIATRIDQYMLERLAIPAEQIPSLRHELHARYGTTLRGLSATRSIDELDYLAFVHDIPVRDFLRPDSAVRAALISIPMRKCIFTNADRAHAARVLSALNLFDLFDMIIDIRDIHPYCKPMPDAYRLALLRAGAIPEDTLFVDDAPRNLKPAGEIGLTTVLVGRPCPEAAEFPCIPSLACLPEMLKHLSRPNHTA